jgi:hypothetical protein
MMDEQIFYLAFDFGFFEGHYLPFDFDAAGHKERSMVAGPGPGPGSLPFSSVSFSLCAIVRELSKWAVAALLKPQGVFVRFGSDGPTTATQWCFLLPYLPRINKLQIIILLMNKLNKRTSQAWLGLRCGGHVCVCP